VDGHVRDSFGRQGGLTELTRSASQKARCSEINNSAPKFDPSVLTD
jgi:hypothetical protein